MNRLHQIVEFCIRHQTVLGYSTVSLLTAASEQIFSSVVFKCPCNSWNMLYGSSFLLAPAFVLLLIGFMVNPTTWHLLTGRCSPEKHLQGIPGGSRARFCQLLMLTIAKALVAPVTWMAVALLGASFYECAASGSSLIFHLFCKDNVTDCQEQLFKMPCEKDSSADIPSEWLSLQAQSQVIGWFLVASVMAVAVISTCVRLSCSPVSYLQLKFRKIYLKREHELFKDKAKEHATKLAERNTNCFFEAIESAPFHTPNNEDWLKISSFYTFNPGDKHYSMIHKYVSTKRGKACVKKEGQVGTDLKSENKAQARVSEL